MKKNSVYFNVTTATEPTNAFKTGLNTDKKTDGLDYERVMYFTDATHCTKWLDWGSAYIREATFPKGTHKVSVGVGDVFRARRFILGPRHSLSKVATWKWMERMGIEVTSDRMFNWASAHGYKDVVKYLKSRGAMLHSWMDVVKFLASKGADVTAPDKFALQCALNGLTDDVKHLK